jgi:hypothetical protein
MKKIICVSNINTEPLLDGIDMSFLDIGKIYEGKSERHELYFGISGYIITEMLFNSPCSYWFPSKCFITLAEFRESRINSILE